MPRRGWAFGSELKLEVSRGRGRKADVSAYLEGRALPGRDRGATSRPPSIVVEVLSSAPRDVRRDVVDKKREYAAFGVQAYWLVDPRARTLEVLELAPDGRYVVALSAADGIQIIPGCDGLALDLDALWARGEGLPDDE
jgi:Uma2 family endonuclease